jgi:hypothetical protein
MPEAALIMHSTDHYLVSGLPGVPKLHSTPEKEI